jgi:hypothetical protein
MNKNEQNKRKHDEVVVIQTEMEVKEKENKKVCLESIIPNDYHYEEFKRVKEELEQKNRELEEKNRELEENLKIQIDMRDSAFELNASLLKDSMDFEKANTILQEEAKILVERIDEKKNQLEESKTLQRQTNESLVFMTNRCNAIIGTYNNLISSSMKPFFAPFSVVINPPHPVFVFHQHFYPIQTGDNRNNLDSNNSANVN